MRTGKYLRLLLSLCLAIEFFPLNAAPQIIDGSTSPPQVNLDSDGQSNGVSFTNQSVTENTLNVPGKNTINSNKNAMGIQTDTNGLGNVIFRGATGNTTVVNGKVGDNTPLFMDTISIGDCTVEFNGGVHCNNVTFFGPGMINLNDNLELVSGGQVSFAGNSVTVNLSGNTTITGNVGTTPASGTVNMQSTSQITGDVVASKLTVQSDKNGGSFIVGNLNAYTIQIKKGILEASPGVTGNAISTTIDTGSTNFFVNGDLTLNSPFLTVIQNDVGNISVGGMTTITGDVQLDFTWKVRPRPTNFPETLYILTSMGGGTSGANITLTRYLDCRMTFYTANVNGNITLSNVPTTSAPVPPVKLGCPWWVKGILGACGSEAMLQLCPVADQYPGSDLDFVERQLSEPTWEEYWDDIYQLYPAQALTGVAQESYNTTKQFQKIFLKHLDRDRCLCRNALVDPSCAPCHDEGTNVKIWMDGFGYFGRQSNETSGKGYDASTWGTVLAVEAPLARTWNLGVGTGYATTFIEKGRFNADQGKTNTTHIDSYQTTAYFTHEGAPWFLDGGFTFGWNRYHGARFISFNDLHRKAHATYNGQEYSGFLTSGYQYCLHRFEITPLAALTYSHVHINSYHESGAETLDLKLKPQNYNFLESSLGFKVAYLFETCYGSFVPEFHAFWLYEYLDRRVDVKASFSELGALAGYFTQTGPKTQRNTWNVGGSFTCSPGSHVSVIVDYDFEFGSSYYDHQGLVEVAYTF